MSDLVIRVYVVDRNNKPVPGAAVTWTFRNGGQPVTFGPATTLGFADKPVDIQIEGTPGETFLDVTARYKDTEKTERIAADKRDLTIKLDIALEPSAPAPEPAMERQPLAAAGYAMLAVAGLAATIFIGWYLLSNPGLLAPNNASARAYYVLLVFLGLAAAAFLFGAMRSTASLRGTQFGTAYDVGGPAAMAVIVVAGGFYFTRPAEDFVLTIRLSGPEPIRNLTDTFARIDFGTRRDERYFGSDGDLTVAGVPAKFLGAELPIEFGSTTYRLKNPRPAYQVPTDAVIRLDVVRKSASELPKTTSGAAGARLVERCADSVQAGQYSIALDRCAQAAAQVPDDYKPIHLLGLAQYHSGQYSQAILSFEKALTLPGPDAPAIWYNIAFVQVDNDDPRGALGSLDKALKSAAGRHPALPRIWFLIASIQQDLWQAASDDASLFDQAVKSYKAFLEIGSPTHWAHGHLACLYAARAARSAAAAAKAADQKTAVAEFEMAVGALRDLKPPSTKASETEAFLKEFDAESQSKCAVALRHAWQDQKAAPFKDQLTSLRP